MIILFSKKIGVQNFIIINSNGTIKKLKTRFQKMTSICKNPRLKKFIKIFSRKKLDNCVQFVKSKSYYKTIK